MHTTRPPTLVAEREEIPLAATRPGNVPGMGWSGRGEGGGGRVGEGSDGPSVQKGALSARELPLGLPRGGRLTGCLGREQHGRRSSRRDTRQ